MASRPLFAVGVDAGSHRTRCAILLLENARVRFLGCGEAVSQGWTKGRISDQRAVSASVLSAVREAEAHAQVPVGSATLGIGGANVCGLSGRGGYEIGFPRKIGQTDLNRVVERASRVQLEEDEIVLHVTPQDFAVDGRNGHRNPCGMIGSRLEVYVHLVTGSAQEHHALVGAANEAHIEVEETVFEPLAAAYAAFRPEDRREGCVIVDIGAHSTGVAAYYGETLLFSSTLPLCGDHFTRDVARGLALNYEDAALIKEQYGCALIGLTADTSFIELPSGPGRPPREAPRRDLNMILEARALELFDFVKQELVQIGLEHDYIACALTGGGARLPGLCDIAEKTIKCQAGIGLPSGILDWPPQIDDPAWTTAAGLAMYSARLKLRAELDRNHRGFFAKVMGM